MLDRRGARNSFGRVGATKMLRRFQRFLLPIIKPTHSPIPMKALTLLFTLALAACPLLAEEGAWLTDLSKAQSLAKSEKKLVLLDFTGSDWCPPCKSLHKNVLTSAEFAKFAKDSLVLVEVDFPRAKPQADALKAANNELKKKFEIKGFPTVIVLDADGKELFKKVGYGGTPAKDYVADLEKLKK